jgi:hypothetical protein
VYGYENSLAILNKQAIIEIAIHTPDLWAEVKFFLMFGQKAKSYSELPLVLK